MVHVSTARGPRPLFTGWLNPDWSSDVTTKESCSRPSFVCTRRFAAGPLNSACNWRRGGACTSVAEGGFMAVGLEPMTMAALRRLDGRRRKQVFELSGFDGGVMPFERPQTPIFPHFHQLRGGRRQRCLHGVGESLDVAGREQPAVHPIFDQLRNPRDVGGYHRSTDGEGFHDDDR